MLTNNVIVVIGGAGRMGSSFVKEILDNNGTAVIADINKHALKKVSRGFKKMSYKNFRVIELDTCSEVSVNVAIKKVHALYGRMDAVVNNSYPKNKNYGRDLWDVQYHDFCENISMHVGGYFLASKLASAYFIKQGWGNIVNISSIYGVVSPRFEIYNDTGMTMPVEYACVKSAIIHLTKYFSKYLKGKNIRVNSISPGGILNHQPKEFIKKYNQYGLSKGMLEPTDVSGALLFLLSRQSQFINGQNIIIDDGWSL